MNVCIYTLGCKVNSYDSQVMTDSFIKKGFKIAGFEDLCDIYVINTCCVTAMSEKKSRQIIRRAKRINPDSIIVVAGCYPQVKKEELSDLSEVDIIIGTDERNKVVSIVKNYIKSNKKRKTIVNNIMDTRIYSEKGIRGFQGKTRAIIKIQDGCNSYCSYCIIPYTRGNIRSRQPGDIIKEVKRIARKGFREIVLTGIHLSSYGKDIEKTSLLDIIKRISKIKKIKRIRLGSLEPAIITEQFVSELSGIDSFCNHFHLSLQSGSDDTLRRMNRKYTTAEYEKAIKTIRDNIEDAGITTDLMVGFPGETREEFYETLSFVKKILFNKMHVFKFSKRQGTKAYDMENQVENNKKDRRSSIMCTLSDDISHERNKKYIGKTVEVLFEQESDRNGYYQGYTKNYILVKAKGKKTFINQIMWVSIKAAEPDCLTGDIKTPDL
jgi:threonylcarbamoyladenosine tRNA methylthiotransferase MtaB